MFWLIKGCLGNNMFQFHKVRLKDQIPGILEVDLELFQFHKVRLKDW